MIGFAGLRIGLIGPVPPPAGGMANQTRQLAELLRADLAEVTMVPTNAPYWPALVGQVHGVRALFRLGHYLFTLWRVARRVQLFHVMANSGWSWHLFAVPAILVAWMLRVPVVINYRGGEAEAFLERSQALVRFAMRHTASRIVPSGFLVDVFQRFGMSCDVVPNIIDLTRFQPRLPRQGDSAQLMVARNLEALYDNATAIRAFALVRAELPHARLTVAGSGPQADLLRALVVELNVADAVTFTGTLDREAMASLYRQSDVSINPSLADNMPNSVLESMASGVPLVTTRVGGVPYLVRDGETGVMVPPGDAPAMAAAVLRVLGEPGLWQRLADAGLGEAQRYSWSKVGVQLSSVYQGAIAQRRR